MATTTIGTVQADERGFQTKKATRNSIRGALAEIGLTCGLLGREGKVYTALITDSEVQVSAAREAGAPIKANCGKRKLTALARAAAEREAAEQEEAEQAEPKRPRKAKKAKKAKAAEPEASALEAFGLLSMDEQGVLTSAHPRDGGLSAGAIRAMLEADGVEVPKRLKKAEMVDLLMEVVTTRGALSAAIRDLSADLSAGRPAGESAGRVGRAVSAEQAFEMEAAFGPGVTVVNALTGKTVYTTPGEADDIQF